MSAHPRRLADLGPLTTHFRRRSGKTSHYAEFLFYDDGDLAIAGYDDGKVSRPLVVAGETIFDKAFKAFRVQRKGETHTTISIYSMDDRFLGVYSDTTLPWEGVKRFHGGKFETTIDDLYLDHYIMPDGRRFVLDLGEFHEGVVRGTLNPAEARLALATVDWLEEESAASGYPAPLPRGLELDPKLLTGLPTSQVG
jgi:predicted RNA-binding protein associated with RNAse of E/G family